MENELIEVEQNQNAVSNNEDPMYQLINTAIQKDMDITKLQSILDLQERMMAKKAEQEYNESFSKMQAELPVIGKNAKGHNSKYATMDEINKAIMPALSLHGFSISFRNEQEQGKVRIIGKLKHKSGHFDEAEITLPFDYSGKKSDIHAIGSTISYGIRYVTNMLLNLSFGEQDDNADNVGRKEPLTQSQRAVIETMIEQIDKGSVDSFNRKYGCVDNVTAEQYPALHAWMKTKIVPIGGANAS